MQKEQAIAKRKMERFEKRLQTLSDGLGRPRTRKQVDYIHQRIGRLQEASGGIAQHYSIQVETDEAKSKATKITWTRDPKADTLLALPGVYGLRTNVRDMDADALWHTYVLLTDLEAVFRSLKSELGLRPVWHHTDKRSEGHLLITVLAYQMVQLIRHQLRTAGLHPSWATIRNRLRSQARSTRGFKQPDGTVLHSRLTDTPNGHQAQILRALGIRKCALGIQNHVARKRR